MTSTSYRRFDAQSSGALRVASECSTQQRLVPWSHRSPSTLFIYLSHRTPPWEKKQLIPKEARSRDAVSPWKCAEYCVGTKRGRACSERPRAGPWTVDNVVCGEGVSVRSSSKLVTPRDPPPPPHPLSYYPLLGWPSSPLCFE